MIRPVFVCGVPLSDLFSMGRPILSLIRLPLCPMPFPVALFGLRTLDSMSFPVALLGLRHAGSMPFPVVLLALAPTGSMGHPILSLIRLALFPMPFPVAVPFFVGGHFLWVLGPVPVAFGHVPRPLSGDSSPQLREFVLVVVGVIVLVVGVVVVHFLIVLAFLVCHWGWAAVGLFLRASGDGGDAGGGVRGRLN